MVLKRGWRLMQLEYCLIDMSLFEFVFLNDTLRNGVFSSIGFTCGGYV